MVALLLQFWPQIIGLIAAIFFGWRLGRSGINAERARQAKEKLAAAEDRLEMDRQAADIERRISGMSDDAARTEAMRWSRN